VVAANYWNFWRIFSLCLDPHIVALVVAVVTADSNVDNSFEYFANG
jgi:hypothetical protein